MLRGQRSLRNLNEYLQSFQDHYATPKPDCFARYICLNPSDSEPCAVNQLKMAYHADQRK